MTFLYKRAIIAILNKIVNSAHLILYKERKERREKNEQKIVLFKHKECFGQKERSKKMLVLILLSLAITMLFTVIDTLRKKGNVVGAVVASFIACLIINWLIIAYFCMPALVGPFVGLTWIVIISLLIAGVVSGAATGEVPSITITAGAIFVALWIFFGIGSTGMFQAANRRAMLGEVKEVDYTKDMRPVDQRHIRIVSKEQAGWLANKRLGEVPGAIGSRYYVGDIHIQRIKGELYWVAPLEFRSWIKWIKYDHTTGYVMVSAEDRNRKVELVIDHKFRYMPSACFGDDLGRHLYTNGYAFYQLEEFTFELDDDLNPYWVISLVKPTHLFTCQKTFGVAIVNAATGDIEFHDMDDIPEWVDRVVPEYLAEKYLAWWGHYIQGWWNSWLGQENVVTPTPFEGSGPDVWLTYGDDEQPYWFTGMTSIAGTDDALCSIAMLSSRTGETKIYSLSGSNEKAVLQVVDSAVSNYEGYHGTQPILYNIYGELSWVSPVIRDRILQRIAIVRASNSTKVLGTDKREALRAYREMLVSSDDTVAPSSDALVMLIKGKISRISHEVRGGNTTYVLFFKEHQKIFTGTSRISSELSIAKEGDEAEVRFFETTEAEVPIMNFDLLAFQLQKSQIQAEVEEIDAAVESRVEQRDEVREFRREVKKMTDEELAELLKTKEKSSKQN